jgi:hypothetical protein
MNRVRKWVAIHEHDLLKNGVEHILWFHQQRQGILGLLKPIGMQLSRPMLFSGQAICTQSPTLPIQEVRIRGC